MVINKFNFPIYGIIITLSLIIGIIYDYIYLKRNKIDKRDIFLFLIMIIPCTLFGGIAISKIIDGNGLSSYAAALSLLICTYIYERVNPHNDIFIKVSILSFPLMYSIGKIGCFLAGCCYGIPYEGIFSVTYTNGLNIPLFPIQIVESILFMILFIILNKLSNKKNIISISLISCGILKFLLDYLRYSHINSYITHNQLLSIIVIIVTIIYTIKKNSK